MSRRTEMLGSTIQRELAEMILRDLHDPRLTGFPSVTRVKVSPDLSIADVYVTIMGTPGAQQAALNALKHSAGLMRTKLTKSLSIRQTPFLKFHLDEALRREMTILDLIRKANEEDRARTGEPAADEAAADDAVSNEARTDFIAPDLPATAIEAAGIEATDNRPRTTDDQ